MLGPLCGWPLPKALDSHTARHTACILMTLRLCGVWEDLELLEALLHLQI